MSELNIQEDIQREVLSIKDNVNNYVFLQPDNSRLALVNGAVVINDWMTILTAPNENSPYVVIGDSDTVRAKGVQTNDGSYFWNIPVDIVVKFVDYPFTRGEVRKYRQYVFDKLTKPDSYNNISGRLAFGIREVQTKTLIYDILDRYDQPQEIRDRYPIFLGQTIMLTVEEKSIG